MHIYLLGKSGFFTSTVATVCTQVAIHSKQHFSFPINLHLFCEKIFQVIKPR